MHDLKLPLVTFFLVLTAPLLCWQEASSQAAPTSTPSTAQTLSVFSREVVVDINVTDAKGNPVHGLSKNNFTVLENGKPVAPRSFREHRPDDAADPAAAAGTALPPNTFTNMGGPETPRPLNILLLDSLNIPIATQSIMQKQLVDFAGKMPAGTRVAVFGIGATGQLAMVQGFTSDRELVKKALKSHKLDMQVSPLEDGGQDTSNDNTLPEVSTTGKKPPRQLQPQEPKIDANLECNHASTRGEYTVNALTQIARYLSGMPGRKNLIWYTGEFPDRMRVKGEMCYDLTGAMGAVDGMLANAHVSVFPVDPRALDILAKEGPDSRLGRQITSEHLAMEAVAEDTGGKTFYNNNDLAAGAEQAIDAGANYYTITYSPPNPNNDTRLRTISVTVDQPGLNLLYKKGYHALPQGVSLSGKPVDKASPIQSAMMRGALEPSEIVFHVNVASAAATDATLPQGNKADPKVMKPPYRHLTLSYLVDLDGIQFDQAADGTYHGQFEFAVNVYDSNDGKLLNSVEMAAKPVLPAAAYQSMLKAGAKLRQEVDVPAKGDYILRVGVHDLTSDRLGAVEIPTSSIIAQAGTSAGQQP
jgi:VWFA-related protein